MIRHFGMITAWALLVMASAIDAVESARANEVKAAPEATFQALDGASVALSDFRGKVVLINFWGTWCEPCYDEIPELVRLSHQFKKGGLEVVGIAVDSGRP